MGGLGGERGREARASSKGGCTLMSRMPAATISSTPPSSGSSARAHTCDGRERASARLVKSWASGRGSTKSDAGVDVVDLERAARCVLGSPRRARVAWWWWRRSERGAASLLTPGCASMPAEPAAAPPHGREAVEHPCDRQMTFLDHLGSSWPSAEAQRVRQSSKSHMAASRKPLAEAVRVIAETCIYISRWRATRAAVLP